LACEDLQAFYPKQDKPVLAGVSLDVPAGRVVGLLGPNGAGKTTLLRCVLGLMPSARGRVLLFGEAWDAPASGHRKPRQKRRLARLGVVLETPGLYRKLSAEEYLGFFFALNQSADPARYAGRDGGHWKERMRELAGRLDFPLDGKPCGRLSQGNRQKLHLIRSLLHEPELLLWDEPTDHLDPTAQADALALVVEQARQKGQAVLLASHRIEQLEKVCDDVHVLVQGRIRRSGSLRDLLRPDIGTRICWEKGFWPAQELTQLALVECAVPLAEADMPPGAQAGLLLAGEAMAKVPDLIAKMAASGYRIVQVNPIGSSLSAIYHQAVKEEVPERPEAGNAGSFDAPMPAAEAGSPAGLGGWEILAKQELLLVRREPRFLLPFLLTSLCLVGVQAFVVAKSGFVDAENLFLSAQPILLLLGVLGPALCIPLAADAFAGEKERNTLEILLCSPLSSAALFLGKVAGLLLFPVGFAWFGQSLLLALLALRGVALGERAPELLLTFGSAPVLAGALGALGITLSIRAETVRAATQSLAPALLVLFLVVPLTAPWLFSHPGSWLLCLAGLGAATLGLLRRAAARWEAGAG